MSQISEYNSIMPIIIMEKTDYIYQKVYLTQINWDSFLFGTVMKYLWSMES